MSFKRTTTTVLATVAIAGCMALSAPHAAIAATTDPSPTPSTDALNDVTRFIGSTGPHRQRVIVTYLVNHGLASTRDYGRYMLTYWVRDKSLYRSMDKDTGYRHIFLPPRTSHV